MREIMKFAMKEALVLTIPDGGNGPDRWRLSSRFMFYVDTDAEKIAFIDWYLTKLEVTELFDSPFHAFTGKFPDGSDALYFQCMYDDLPDSDEDKENERVFPIGSDANKLALADQIIAGELDMFFSPYLTTVRARVPVEKRGGAPAAD